MEFDKQTLERLSNLELEQYAGDLRAIKGKDRELYNRLFEHFGKIISIYQ